VAALAAGKHLFGEKPFGIDLPANEAINAEIARNPQLLVRCSSELPFYPGGQEVARFIDERRFGRVVEVRSLFLHSSDLDPHKPINWKRMARFNGEYGCMGDLGMHALHLPLRAGWRPRDVRAILSDVVTERPGPDGEPVPCDTWDNAVLLCAAEDSGKRFPLRIETKRIAPGETNTWTIEVDGTESSIAYTTKFPKTLRTLEYRPGAPQGWQAVDLGSVSAYPHVTGPIFESGFSDAILQMWAAFLDELAHGREGMRQPFHCATPEEAAATHRLFTAALVSERDGTVEEVA
jgi:predicted dehydrogenase